MSDTEKEPCSECGGDGCTYRQRDVDVFDVAGVCEHCEGDGCEPETVFPVDEANG